MAALCVCLWLLWVGSLSLVGGLCSIGGRGLLSDGRVLGTEQRGLLADGVWYMVGVVWCLVGVV